MTTPDGHDLRLRVAVEDLCDILDRLGAKHGELYDLLEAQQEALVEVRTEDVDGIRQREEELLQGVIEEEKERLLVTEEIGDLLDHDDPIAIRVAEMIPHLEPGLARRLTTRRENLEEVARRLSRQNEINRALIEHSLGHVQVFMSRVVSEEIASGGYDSHGSFSGPGHGSFFMDRRG